ncbi:MAG: class I SAM-dependent DNA methyltransferase [Fimbriimonadaceae bacterium]|nr:class I SAM-dependent DNA methyltransferase [Fimbriimonadaceae bacterium]
MTWQEFKVKWRAASGNERQTAQEHFVDLCRALGHPTPNDPESQGTGFAFEKGVAKAGGGDGWADVWKRHFFGWEYKGKHKDLDKAYGQLLRYRDNLENPPLLVVSDIERIVVRTNFTNTPTQVHTIPLEETDSKVAQRVLRAVFFNPESLKPRETRDSITQAAARQMAEIVHRNRNTPIPLGELSRFIDRCVFCFYAEDVELLPKGVFEQLIMSCQVDPKRFRDRCREFFKTMSKGGDYGSERIRWFNGNLFQEDDVPEMDIHDLTLLARAAQHDWRSIDPQIFGGLYQQVLEATDQRAELGAHYTKEADIRVLVEPVLMAPFRAAWSGIQGELAEFLGPNRLTLFPADHTWHPVEVSAEERQHIEARLREFRDRLAGVRVLDPACGSGNFLYVALRLLKDLEKEVRNWAARFGIYDLGGPEVTPRQLYGIEKSEYAWQLAQLTVWIAYLQWRVENGETDVPEPVLQTQDTFTLGDAIVGAGPEWFESEHSRKPPATAFLSKKDADGAWADPAQMPGLTEPVWPEADVVVGNPPFIGSKYLRRELGDAYVNAMFRIYSGRVARESDLVCYWFEKAREAVAAGRAQRVGLLATQGIRGGANREVLKRVIETGGIFFAESDRPWWEPSKPPAPEPGRKKIKQLRKAAVQISMVGFDDGSQTERVLDGKPVAEIHSDLTSGADLTSAGRLHENEGVCFMGTTKGGAFDIPFEAPGTLLGGEAAALAMLQAPNPHGRPNSDVLVPWVNGSDLTGRGRHMWVVDFGVAMPREEAAKYEAPFEYLKAAVEPVRAKSRSTIEEWWLHERRRGEMRSALAPLGRYLVTVRVAKHRIFSWISEPIQPDSSVFVFAREDDYFFGVLQSSFHRLWALATGTQLREKASGFRYTPETCFDPFPFPPPGSHDSAITEATKSLHDLRDAWLNPPEWMSESTVEFPASEGGPWQRHLVPGSVGAAGVGTARYTFAVAKMPGLVKNRTLTELYNQFPTWLEDTHAELDEAVADAYGYKGNLEPEAVNAFLLALNLERGQSEH